MKNLSKTLKIVFTLFLNCFFLQGFSQAKNNFTIKGSFKDIPTPPSKVYLIYPEFLHRSNDSANVKNGAYELKGSIDEVTGVELALTTKAKGNPNLLISVMLQKGELNVLSTGTFHDAIFSGPGAAAIHEFEAVRKKNIEKIKALQDSMKSDKAKTDPVFKQRLSDGLMEQFSASIETMYLYARDNPNSAISPYMAYLMTSSGILHTDKQDTLASIVPSHRGWYYTQTQAIVTKRHEDQQKLAEARAESEKTTPLGSMAKDFTANDVNGTPVSLTSFRGKYVLVDFWASWCGPCRAENPNVVKAYNTFKDKGFTVLGVSLDAETQKLAWMAAIKKDGLTWTQVSELKGWKGEISKQYGVDAIPKNFLIDPNGNIVGKNLRGEDLQTKLSELLK